MDGYCGLITAYTSHLVVGVIAELGRVKMGWFRRVVVVLYGLLVERIFKGMGDSWQWFNVGYEELEVVGI